MPTTKKQSVLVYALNVLLLFNLTVIVVMLSGTGQDFGDKPEHAAGEPVDRVTVSPGPVESVASPRWSEAVGTVSPHRGIDVSAQASPVFRDAQPNVQSQPSSDQSDSNASANADVKPTQTQPQQDDAPITFFGIGIE